MGAVGKSVKEKSSYSTAEEKTLRGIEKARQEIQEAGEYADIEDAVYSQEELWDLPSEEVEAIVQQFYKEREASTVKQTSTEQAIKEAQSLPTSTERENALMNFILGQKKGTVLAGTDWVKQDDSYGGIWYSKDFDDTIYSNDLINYLAYKRLGGK